jgi:hypothetical protein
VRLDGLFGSAFKVEWSAVDHCHGIVPCDMSSNDVHQLDANTVNGSWSVPEKAVSRMGVSSVLLHGVPRYNDVLSVGENATERVVF